MAVSVGLIGAGERGRLRAKTLVDAPGVVLFGIADSDPARATALAERTGCTAFSSTPSLLDSVDAVCICTSTRDHFLIASEAIRLGRHVFVEWPPSVSIPEAQTLARLAEEADVQLGISCPLLAHRKIADPQRTWAPSIVHLTYRYGEDDGLSWPHEFAEALALGTVLGRSPVVVRLHAQAARSSRPGIQTVAFTARLQSGAFVLGLLHRGNESPAKTLFLAGPDQTETIDLLPTAGEEASAFDNTPEDLLDRELRAFLASARSGSLRVKPLFSIRDAVPVMHLLERLLGKLR